MKANVPESAPSSPNVSRLGISGARGHPGPRPGVDFRPLVPSADAACREAAARYRRARAEEMAPGEADIGLRVFGGLKLVASARLVGYKVSKEGVSMVTFAVAESDFDMFTPDERLGGL